MTQHSPQLNMSDMRARLRESRVATPENSSPAPTSSSSQAFDFRAPPPKQPYPFPGEAASMGAKISKMSAQAKGPLWHLHLYWHRYLAGFIFLFIQLNMLFPQLMPARGETESVYSGAEPLHAFIVFMFITAISLGIYFLLARMRGSFQQAAKITEIKTWSPFEKGAAAVGFIIVFYLTFFYAGGVHGSYIGNLSGVTLGDPADPNFGNIAPRNVPGRFDLSAREWVLSGVKCCGGAVAAVLFTRRFLAGENPFWGR